MISFGKLAMMSSAHTKSAGGGGEGQIHAPRSIHSSIHSTNIVPYNLDSNLYSECILSM